MFIVLAATLSDGHMVKKNFKVDQIYQRGLTMRTRSMTGTTFYLCLHLLLAICGDFSFVPSIENISQCLDPYRPVDDEEVIAEYPSFVHPNIWYVPGSLPMMSHQIATLVTFTLIWR